ncbi:PREDICTED: NADH-cytochrome b5 reductase-like [Amphimedon queenslandica]|uniref:FAD-binding FR-type domain-containing protein n=1 Tax=Amphimedon queenslandica TaxID=400682 RepID=A0AAN0IW44_AMPQE|nr:PREDICTED: NADH-cytochrome b5 reductase-like [Amphimedon queenslandica]|eukprot:XP_019848984.1 PREDICTED: NADH-cytochrome b5 reductase-like [Amphimedon queenslandica]
MATAAYDDGGNDEWLPEKPQKPLPSDCCGTGCSPCVNDIYEREMEKWFELQRMSIEERQRIWRGKQEAQSETEKALSPEKYNKFELISFIQVSRDSFLCSFKLPQNQTLGIKVGQHATMRLKDHEGKYIARQYTPISPLNQKDHFEVLIKVNRNITNKLTTFVLFNSYIVTVYYQPLLGPHLNPVAW